MAVDIRTTTCNSLMPKAAASAIDTGVARPVKLNTTGTATLL
jgi:hypothetical protein